MSIQDLGVIVSILFSTISIGIVVYTQFLQGAKLSARIDQIVQLRLQSSDKDPMIIELIMDDLLSGSPSAQAQALIAPHPKLRPFILQHDRQGLQRPLVATLLGRSIKYDPPANLVRRYVNDPRYRIPFMIPLTIVNSGKKFSYVSSLVLVVQPQNNRRLVKLYVTFFEIDPLKVIVREKEYSDQQRMSRMFAGFGVAPLQSTRINPMFIPMKGESAGVVVNLTPAEYVFKIVGFGENGKKVLETPSVKHTVNEDAIIGALAGSEITDFVSLEDDIKRAKKSVE